MQIIKTQDKFAIDELKSKLLSSDLLLCARIVTSIDAKKNKDIYEEANNIFKEKLEQFSNNKHITGYEERVLSNGLVDANISPNSRVVPVLLLTAYLIIGLSIASNYSGAVYYGAIIVTLLVSVPQLLMLYEGSKAYLRKDLIELIKRNKNVKILYKSIIKFERVGSSCLIWYVEDGQIKKQSFVLKKTGSFNSISSRIKKTLWPK